MLVERLRKEWHAREAASDLHEALCLKSEGLVLGAGTVLVRMAGGSTNADCDDDRLKALLSVAYGKPVANRAIGHVKAAALRWRDGETARATLHLALSRLASLDNPSEAARRLFMADGLMHAGVMPAAILDGLDIEAASEAITKKYNPDQPRVPAGSGHASGEWTSGGGSAGPGGADDDPVAGQALPQQPLTPPNKPTGSNVAPSVNGVGRPGLTLVNFAFPAAGAVAPVLDMGAMSAAALSALAAFIAGLAESAAVASAVSAGGAAAALGVLFIPSTGPKGQWINVDGPGDVSYFQQPDETAIVLKYTTADGVRHTFATAPGPGGDYPGPDGRVIGRLIMAGAKAGLVISTAELVGNDSDEPRVCPAATKDNGGERGADYEDYAKSIFNPGNPTPHKMAYAFFNPVAGKWVKIDDCQQQSGDLAEYKGKGFESHFLKKDPVWAGMLHKMLGQAQDQIGASGDRSLTWYFEEKPVEEYIKTQFADKKFGIDVKWLPWPGRPR